VLEAIGFVRNNVGEPQPFGWERVDSRIELRSELATATEGLERYSHITVVFELHLVPGDRRALVYPAGGGMPEQGILATRSQLRPNPIGVTVCELLAVEGPVLRVRGLDAIDGTPVLDVRPYIPYYDSVPGARVPGWARPPEPAGRAE
jgi:tRNA-Thr(GGU) m(6)t(6)A37 methyltransferase TsaA